jgi:hypothetical protein
LIILVRYYYIGGYKLFDASNRRVVISRDVIVDKIKELLQPIIDYIKVVTGYSFENSDYVDTGSA